MSFLQSIKDQLVTVPCGNHLELSNFKFSRMSDADNEKKMLLRGKVACSERVESREDCVWMEMKHARD